MTTTITETRESELLASVPDGLFIGGQWRAASGGKTLKVYDPSNGETVKVIGLKGTDMPAASAKGIELCASTMYLPVAAPPKG